MPRDFNVPWMRSRVTASLIVIVSIVCESGCSKTLSASQQRGQAYYTFNCYDCHEGNQLGLIKIPPKLHGIFSHRYLPDGSTLATDQSVREVIINGKHTMPAFNGRLSSDRINDIIAYLHSK